MGEIQQDRGAGHTPGPWGHWGYRVIAETDEQIVARTELMRRASYDAGHLEGVANARLIAAAPESHERLVETTDYLDAMLAEEWLPESAQAEIAVQIQCNRAAIAKARGQ